MSNINTTPATYAEAIKAGYRDSRQSWQRGYVSRKADPTAQPVLTAKDGTLYVLLPSWRSTTYCIRQYLART